ncbi:hypothetical protein SNE510_64840 [Streptomyces sp. NE5-10]|uniref:DUF6193 family natural product biosynthesis protein n=1 Tax=Streptomyces sp. NE5-10 TaxID=2759674 RepID=UPI001908C1FC|nr:DUF6193 family natural product biosynthesis protein [Streptomyces sp. NE5-10]GHJ96965.1 hypothetical protein SNE510_64840 [Streptomyces sp. NE5-10]
MPPPPDPAAPYSDAAASGSLDAALRAVADGALDDVPLTSPADEPLDAIHAAAPFARPEPAGPDPVQLVESEWSLLRAEAAALTTPWAHAHRDLVEAAHAAPEFRALYPFTSHWALRFSSSTRPLLDIVGPVLWCTGEGGFRMAPVMSEQGQAFGTAHEAVAAALRLLPDGIGPVRYGELPQSGR